MSEPAVEPASSEDSASLVEEVRALTRAVENLSVRVGALESERDSVEARSTGYSVVTPAASQAASGFGHLVAQPKAAATSTPAVQTWEQREVIAAEVGRWLRASLGGHHRGNSGRDRILLSSRLYIVIRDFSGVVTTDPVRIYSRFAEVREICFRGHWGDSVFVGLPSQREVGVCLRAGGFTGPQRFP